MKNKILILGEGLLGSELKNQTGWDCVSRKQNGFDITDPKTFHLLTTIELGVIQYCSYDIIVNCIAHTDTYSSNKDKHWEVNIKGTKNLIEFCNKWKVKLVQVSTDYLYTHSKENSSEEDVPVHCATWYGYTKLVSDALVQLECNEHLIIRTTHKPSPFPYEQALINQVGNFDYVNKISELISQLINKNPSGVFNVGTELKSMYDLALQTNPTVKKLENLHPFTPTNVSMNTTKLNKILKL